MLQVQLSCKISFTLYVYSAENMFKECSMCCLSLSRCSTKITDPSITLPLTPILSHWLPTPHTHIGHEFRHTHICTAMYPTQHTNIWIRTETYILSLMCQCLARVSKCIAYCGKSSHILDSVNSGTRESLIL